MNKNLGITLVALVITIIVLLILAGVTINLTLGENGLLKRTEQSGEEYTKSGVQEELDLVIADLRIKKVGKGITDEEIEEKLKEIGAIVLDKTGGIIIGEYKDYEIQVDENRKITVGEKLTGARPTGTVNILTKEEGVDKVEIQVIASVADGEIATIEAIDGAILKENNSSTEKKFEVTANGEYHFKITGTNKRIAIVGTKVSNIVEYNDIFSEIEKIEDSGVKQIEVTGKQSNGKIEKVQYSLNVINHKGNVILDGTQEVEGIVPKNNVYEFGSAGDVGTASGNAQNTVVLKVDGDLTINSGVTLTAVKSSAGYGGPKGMIIYCTGKLTNNGIISMTARGAKAVGQNVYLYRNSNNTYEYVPAAGGAGGARETAYSGTSTYYGSNGVGGTARGTGGGSSGVSEGSDAGAGSAGTSYSGGSGGGGGSWQLKGGDASRKWWKWSVVTQVLGQEVISLQVLVIHVV